MTEYAGESLAKKLARGLAYRAARQLITSGWGTAICLAGPEACDVNPLTTVGYGPDVAHDVTFVDTDPVCLATAKNRLPGCVTHCGPLSTLHLVGRSVRLAVLDFCGHAEGDNFRGLVHVARHLMDGSVLAVTTLRGRESRGDAARSIRRARRAADEKGIDYRAHTGLVRAANLAGELAGALQCPLVLVPAHGARQLPRGPRLTLAGFQSYDGPVSPMLITLFTWSSRPPPDAILPRIGRISRDESETKHAILRSVTTITRRSGDDDYACRLFNISRATLAAWRAHKTMGTYGAEALHAV